MDQQYVYKPSWVKISFLALGLIALIGGGYFLAKKKVKVEPAEPTQVYEALVMVTDEKASDPVEDLRSSLKAGDVLVILPEGHRWLVTEKTSYLLIKMNLTEEQAENLVQSEMKDVENPDPSSKEQLQEITRARAWRLKIETLGFDVQKFWENPVQPYQDKIYDWNLAEKK